MSELFITIQLWIASLNNNTFAVRQKAQAHLVTLGELGRPFVQHALDNAVSAEQRNRCAEIINHYNNVGWEMLPEPTEELDYWGPKGR